MALPSSTPERDERGGSSSNPSEVASDTEEERDHGRSPALGPVAATRKAKLRAALFEDAPQTPMFGRYLVLDTLGRGGMGTVLEAFDPSLDRRVALKVLHIDVAEHHSQRLVREARALARLSHPNVVHVYEAGEVDERAFVAMELVRGRTLLQWAQREPRPGWRMCVELYVQAGAGLAAVHAQGLVHRDFKPTNAIVDDEGRVRVLDFGLVRRAGRDEEERSWTDAVQPQEHSVWDVSLTRTGAVLGTPAYMALEQMTGGEADARSDQFSFCVSLYEAVYGLRPYEGSSQPALMAAMTAGTVQSPQGAKVPAALRRVLLRGLAVDPAERWPSMDALLAELRRLVAPRILRWLAVGLAVGLTVVGIGLARYAEVGFRCEGARAQLEGVWDEARRSELQTAILGTGLSYAAETWDRVEPRIDARVNAWVAKHAEVCEATRVTQAQPESVMALRMGCLSSRRLELQAAVEVLLRADPTRVSRAVELVESLPDSSRCDDVEALQAERRAPEQPQQASEVAALRERLVVAWALTVAGDHAGSEAEAHAVVKQAEALGHGLLLAEARLARGRARRNRGDHANAQEDLEHAYFLALEHEHHEVELGAATELVDVVGHRRADADRGQEWGAVAFALSRRTGTGGREQALVHDFVGVVLMDRGQLDEALEHFEQALATQEESLGARHSELAISLDDIGIALGRKGRWSEAQQHHERALAIRMEALGPHHPNVANSMTNLANDLDAQGRREEALEHHRRALAIREQAQGPRHPEVAASESNIGMVLDELGRREEALEHHRRALAIREASLGPRHPEVAISLIDLGAVLEGQGKREQALALFLRALDIDEEVLGPRHSDLAVLSSNIGFVLAGLGRLDEALLYHQRALDIAEESLGPQHSTVAVLLDNLGELYLAQGGLGDAKRAYQRALGIAEESLGREHPVVAYSLVGLAEVALREHDDAAALPHAERALAIREAGEVAPTERAQARFVLARALWSDRAEHARARALAEQARDGYAAHLEGSETQLAEVVAWLAERE